MLLKKTLPKKKAYVWNCIRQQSSFPNNYYCVCQKHVNVRDMLAKCRLRLHY